MEENKVTLVPIRETIIVLPDKVEDKTGSLILPDYSKKRPTTGTIVALGEMLKEYNIKNQVKFEVGMRVVYGEFAGSKENLFPYGEVFLMQPEDILAILT